MKIALFLLIVTFLSSAYAQVFNEKEAKSPSENLKVKKLVLRQPLNEVQQNPLTTLSFGDFKSNQRVFVDVVNGDVTFTVSDPDKAAVIFWDGLLKLEKVGRVIKAEGNDLSIGASRYGDIKNGGVISTSPKSVILAGKKTWININLVTGTVKWRKGMVPNADSRVFWDAVVLRFAAVKESLKD